ncbi:bifunctional DNA primase/polymerase [Rhodococcus opacus]|nr:bifunctional DNA primase/polymerase [Rhodococcus opacus]
MPEPDDTPRASPYADGATELWNAGWRGVLPTKRPGTKWPIPEGYTGYEGVYPSYADLMAWTEDKPASNIALRMPKNIIGIDVDAYDKKQGAVTFARALELWGPLPDTWISTSRNDGVSGIRFFTIPEGTALRTIIELDGTKDIEIVQYFHRYAIVAPSVHPLTSSTYRWVMPDGTDAPETVVPEPHELPTLPDRWLTALEAPIVDTLQPVDVQAALRDMPGGQMDLRVTDRLGHALADLQAGAGSRHDTTNQHVLALLRLAEQECAGVPAALQTLREAFAFVVIQDGSRHSIDDARNEFDRMVTGTRGHALIAATPTISLEVLAGLAPTPKDTTCSTSTAGTALDAAGAAPHDPTTAPVAPNPTPGGSTPGSTSTTPPTAASSGAAASPADTRNSAHPDPTPDAPTPTATDGASSSTANTSATGAPTAGVSAECPVTPAAGTNTATASASPSAQSPTAAAAATTNAPSTGTYTTSAEAGSAPAAPSTDGDDAAWKADCDWFWTTRPSLAAVKTWAAARMCSPWSVLGVIMCRALTTIPPWITLPPIIGGRGSLNFFVALVGNSGGGKGTSESCAADALPCDCYIAPEGSGEGLAHLFIRRVGKNPDDIERVRNGAMLSIAEVDTLASIGGRTGSTIMPKLRNAFSGEEIGFSYADASKRLLVGKHNYRLTVSLGVQPERAGALLSDAGGGTPQRFLWLPTNDPDISRVRPTEPPPLKIPEGGTVWGSYARSIAVPAVVEDTVLDAHVRRSQGHGDALDGHALFVREKAAVALALLDGRTDVNDNDWTLTGILMDMSDRTRASVSTTLSQAEVEAARAMGRLDGMRRAESDDAAGSERVQRIGRRIVANLEKYGPETPGYAYRRIASRDRDYVEEAMQIQVAAGVVVLEAGVLRLPNQSLPPTE